LFPLSGDLAEYHERTPFLKADVTREERAKLRPRRIDLLSFINTQADNGFRLLAQVTGESVGW
jgi:hypothetical protein